MTLSWSVQPPFSFIRSHWIFKSLWFWLRLPLQTYFVFRPIKFLSNLILMIIEIKEIHYQDSSKQVLCFLVLDPELELLEQHIGHFFEDYYSECNRTFQDQNAPYNEFIRCFHQFVSRIFLSWKRKLLINPKKVFFLSLTVEKEIKINIRQKNSYISFSSSNTQFYESRISISPI